MSKTAPHTEAVDAIAFSPDGTRLATGGSDNTLPLDDTVVRMDAGRSSSE